MILRAKLAQLPVTRIARVVAIVAIAMAAGHLAQALAQRKPAPVVVAALPTHIVQLSSGGASDGIAVPVNPEPHLLALEAPSLLPACVVDLALRALPSAMIAVDLTAPCHAGERIVIHHAGLAVTAKVAPDGKVNAKLPAMTSDGAVAVLFADGARVDQAVAVPEAASLRRFGVQWQDAGAFVLHAFENGADFDQPGDITARNPGGVGLVSGGFLTVLGDSDVENALLAEVYTFPAVAVQEPRIVVEAAVLAQTCGQDLLGEVLTSQSGRVTVTDLTVAMPDCTAVGDFLVLNNLASDMKIAAN